MKGKVKPIKDQFKPINWNMWLLFGAISFFIMVLFMFSAVPFMKDYHLTIIQYGYPTGHQLLIQFIMSLVFVSSLAGSLYYSRVISDQHIFKWPRWTGYLRLVGLIIFMFITLLIVYIIFYEIENPSTTNSLNGLISPDRAKVAFWHVSLQILIHYMGLQLVICALWLLIYQLLLPRIKYRWIVKLITLIITVSFALLLVLLQGSSTDLLTFIALAMGYFFSILEFQHSRNFWISGAIVVVSYVLCIYITLLPVMGGLTIEIQY